MAEPDKKSIAENLAKSLTDWTAVLDAGNPLLLVAIQIGKAAYDWAQREQIDPGPFAALIGSIKIKINAGIDAHLSYVERHADPNAAPPPPPPAPPGPTG